VKSQDTSESAISVYVLEQNRLLRQALVHVLRKRTNFTVSGDGDDGAGALEALNVTRCDILLLSSLETLRAICQRTAEFERLKEIKMVLFGMEENPECFLEAVQLGTTGFLLKEASSTELIMAMRAVAHGEATCPPKLCKWLFDHVVGALILVSALPLMAMVAIAIALDSPGPILFRQKRFGFNNERIDVFKFRSMYHHLADPTASKVVTKGDPRVTRVGRFIRKTSLDELPQLFNVVFKSNLSLVGPRPHAVQGKLQSRLFDEAVDGYFARHRVKPGITGWAQINGWRGEVDTDEKIQKRVEFDLYYIENWSVLFDICILLKTPLALMTKNENAY